MTTKEPLHPADGEKPPAKDGYVEDTDYHNGYDDEFEYDDRWDHIYDDNEHQNIIYKSRRRSSKKSKNKDYCEDE